MPGSTRKDTSWLKLLREIYTAESPAESDPPGDASALWRLAMPAIRWAVKRTAERAEPHLDGIVANGDLQKLCTRAIPWPHLSTMIMRTGILELNVARLRGDLQGDDSAARFCDFAMQLGDPARSLAVLEQYPVLGRLLIGTLERWSDVTATVLERLGTDWTQITAELVPPESRLVELQSAGDPHRGGQTVILFTFDGGERLVYKPRSLAPIRHFGELWCWLGERAELPSLRCLGVIDKETYGWVEYVEHAECVDESEIHDFYVRLGALMAVLFTIDAVDLHSENLVAGGAHPLAVDLECLFGPRLYEQYGPDGELVPPDNEFNTVLTTGLLPERSWVGDEEEGVDLSGIAAGGGQAVPGYYEQFTDDGTDNLRIEQAEAPALGADRNRPSLDGVPADPTRWTDQLVKGFTIAYRALLAHGEALIAGPLQAFADDEFRLLLRDTSIYGEILDRCFHPDLLRDEAEWERGLESLPKTLVLPQILRVRQAELSDLRRGDVPLFTSRPQVTHVWDANGVQLSNFYPRPALDFACDRIRSMDEADLERQIYAIRLSMDAVSPPALPTMGAVTPVAYEPERCLAEARRIGDQLVALAFPAADLTGWVTLRGKGEVWWTECSDHRLDRADAGIGLFLAWLAYVTGEGSYRSAASRTLYSLRFETMAFLRRGDLEALGPDHATGWGGVIGAMGEMARLLGDAVAAENVESLAEGLGKMQWKPPGELVAGLLRAGGPRARTVAERLGSRIDPQIPASSAGHHALFGGRAGRIDALLDAPQRDLAAIEAEAGIWLAELSVGGPRTGLPGGLPAPGLARGLAGIGHGLLRLACPDQVPSAWTGQTKGNPGLPLRVDP